MKVPVAKLRGLDYAFDHAAIIEDYLVWRRRARGTFPRDAEPFRGGAPVSRDSCTRVFRRPCDPGDLEF